MRAKDTVLQLKITLEDVLPKIWRRVLIPADATFWDLHCAIQDAMGWDDTHLHGFYVANPETGLCDPIGIPNEDLAEEDDFLPAWDVPIGLYLRQKRDEASYLYDYGANWEHTVVLEKLLPRDPSATYPLCTEGARACPPEDCGGPSGYGSLVEILATPSDPEHEEMKEWAGEDFDPEAFDPADVYFDDPKERLRMTFGDEGPPSGERE